MAKCIYICSRQSLPVSIKGSLYGICKRLAPDNINMNEPKIMASEYAAFGIMNPTTPILEKGNSLLIGQIFDKPESWSLPLSEFPDGSYALFRDGKEHFEIVSDPLASRTIWYYADENIVVTSTSQRAIVMYLESFEFDENVVPWMLSTGTLGPVFSWDKRIKRVPADSSVILDKMNWTLSVRSNPIEFNSVSRSDEMHEKVLTETIGNFFKSLDLDFDSWVLPLSGGYDSRGILCFLAKNRNIQHLKTVTWGLESSQQMQGNDAYVARELAATLNVSHRYYHTDLSKEPIERIINRFVLLGEGRIDHVAAYMDGFEIWKTLFEEGIKGTIRGDESFGWLRTSSALGVKISTGCALCSDYSNLKDYTKYGVAGQDAPQFLDRKNGETFAMWRDRLYQEYRIPTILSALSDLKLSYVEQISPFLSKKILYTVRQLPDRLRTEKKLFKKIVRAMSPKVGFATSSANAWVGDIFQEKRLVEFLKSELSSVDAKKLFTEEFLDFILKGIKSETKEKNSKARSNSLRSYAKRYLPLFLIRAMRKVSPPVVDRNILAFRVFLIYKMNEILKEDSLIRKDFNSPEQKYQ
ncbi:MAG TPA: asparagine synthase-related protein [Chitinophagaceae bacterium]|jgi:asparagine synthase|nr:asparagine synthase-related protein [Chitinophagaceae bacterium]